MEETNNIEVVNDEKLLEEQLIKENNVDELKKIINLFNLNIKKKDILRASKLSDLQDSVVNEMILRMEQIPGSISNDSLVNFYKTIQGTIDKSDRSLDTIDTTAIQINQQQINLNVPADTLDTGSKMRIADAIKSVLKKMEKQEVIESSESDTNE